MTIFFRNATMEIIWFLLCNSCFVQKSMIISYCRSKRTENQNHTRTCISLGIITNRTKHFFFIEISIWSLYIPSYVVIATENDAKNGGDEELFIKMHCIPKNLWQCYRNLAKNTIHHGTKFIATIIKIIVSYLSLSIRFHHQLE